MAPVSEDTKSSSKPGGVLHFAEVVILPSALMPFCSSFSKKACCRAQRLNLHYFLFATSALNRTHDFEAGFARVGGALDRAPMRNIWIDLILAAIVVSSNPTP
jgi:hypothetical protein